MLAKDTDNNLTVIPKYVGICGSDKQKLRAEGCDISKLGHEIVGVSVNTNELVAVNPLIACGRCIDCLKGRTYLCSNLLAIGRNTAFGGFAGKALSIPAINAVPVQDSPVFCLTDPLAVVIHSIDICHINTKQETPCSIAIIGDGVIAQLLAIYVAITLPDAVCTVILKNQSRVCRYEKLFTDIGIKPSLHTAESTPKSCYGAVFECVGDAQSKTLNTAIEIAANGANIVGLGVFPVGFFASIYIREVFYKELCMVGSNSYTHSNFIEAASFVKKHSFILNKLIGASIDGQSLSSYVSRQSGSRVARKDFVLL